MTDTHRLLVNALRVYANPDNWSRDEDGVARLWCEPDSFTPYAYDGFEGATKALAALESAINSAPQTAPAGQVPLAELRRVHRYATELGHWGGDPYRADLTVVDKWLAALSPTQPTEGA